MTMQSLFYRTRTVPALLCFVLLPGALHAENIGAEPPRPRFAPSVHSSDTSSAVSLSEGNLMERVPISSTRSANGPTISIAAVYNSYNADGSKAAIDTVMGYGWTHSYNTFLFTQFGAMFRYDETGRVVKYGLGGPGGTYITASGYFETLTKTSNTVFTLTQKDQTVYTFTLVPSTPFLVAGPVWQLTQIVDRNGNKITLSYTNGNLTAITDTYGRITTFTYTAFKKVASIKDPAARTTTFQYDPTGHQLLSIIDPNGNSIRYTYNSFYQLISKTDKAGRQFTYAYSNNKPIAVDDSLGTSPGTLSNSGNWATNSSLLAENVTRTYVPATTAVTDGRGNTWKYQYDSNGYILQTTAPDGSITAFTYDPATLMVASTTDADGNTSNFKYDGQGNLIQKTDALGNITTFTYDPVFNMPTSMTDPRGRVTTYTIDGHGNRIQAKDPLGQTQSWTYDIHGNILTATDKNGNKNIYTYDSSGDLTQTTDPLGNNATSAYDTVGNMVSHTDANGNTTSYQYDGLNRLVKVTDALSHTIQTFYDGEGNRVEIIDQNGHSISYQYDLRQRLTTAVDALGHPETYTYDGNDNRISLTDRNTHTTLFAYDVQNRPNQVTDALGDKTSTTYDGVGNILTSTDANGHTATNTYDALNRRASMSDALSEVTNYQYDTGTLASCATCGATPGSSLITGQTDANGKVIYFKYDALDRKIDVVRKVGSVADTIVAGTDAVTVTTYDPVGNLLTLTEPDGNTTTLTYDADNRLVKRVNAAGDTTAIAYDGFGNVISTTAPNLNVITNTYDALNRVTKVSDSVGLVATYTYDAVNNRLTYGDGNSNITSYAYDADNRLVTTTDPLTKSTTTVYDPVGNQLQITDRNGNNTTWSYDAANRRITKTDALGNVTQSQYDPVGNVTKLTDANSHATQYAFDAVNRQISETFADGTARSYTYDKVGNVLTRTDQLGQVTQYAYNDLYFLLSRSYPSQNNDTFSYDLSGRMLNAERADWLESFSYDGADRITRTLFPSLHNLEMISYTYDIPNRTRTLSYPSGANTITEHTDARYRMDHIDDVFSPPSIVQYTYDLGDRVTSRAYRNGTAAVTSYNANNWILNLQHSAGASPIAAFSYAYDNEGNKLYEQKLDDTTHSEAYAYDEAYKLTNYAVGTLAGSIVPAPTTQTSYNLDPVGNWTSETTNAVTQTRVHNSTNELVGVNSAALTYDANGNLLNDGSYIYKYDEENRLTQITQIAGLTVVGQYQYDALGRRVYSNGFNYFYDGARLIEKQDFAGGIFATYVYGNDTDEVLSGNALGNSYYYHQNALGSVEAVTNSTGTPVERYAYDAYGLATVTDGTGNAVPPNPSGTPHSAIGNPFLFTGQRLDEEAGLYFYRARYQNPSQGRFISRDPIGIWGDPANRGNGYAYVGDNPTRFTDPYGMLQNASCGSQWWDALWDCGAALVGGIGLVDTGGALAFVAGVTFVRAGSSCYNDLVGMYNSGCTDTYQGGYFEVPSGTSVSPGPRALEGARSSCSGVEPAGPIPGQPTGPPPYCLLHPASPDCLDLPVATGSLTSALETYPAVRDKTYVKGPIIRTIKPPPFLAIRGAWTRYTGPTNSGNPFPSSLTMEPSGPIREPLYCRLRPADPGCLDLPIPPGEPFPLLALRSSLSYSYLDPCGAWGTPETCLQKLLNPGMTWAY